jgi:quercetin dioxygenase-like cupin family protein
MTARSLLLVAVLALVFCGQAVLAQQDGLKSGPQVGESLPGPFHSLVAFSAKPGLMGKKTDFIEMYGQAPVVLVFARELTNPLTRLVNKLEAEAAKDESGKVRIVLVLLSDDDSVETNLKEFGEQQAIKHANLAMMEPDGPKPYKLSKAADITVLVYKRWKVEANYAFKKGELGEKDIDKIVAEASKVASGLQPTAPRHKDAAEIELFPTDKIKWRPGPPSLPKGAMMAVLEGDPGKEGPFVFRVKVPDGYRVPPHTHPRTERVTVISGCFNIGMGDKFDAKTTQEMPAGAYGSWQAGMKHFVWAKGETVLQFHGMGPWSIQYVNPDDDPRKKKD